jgi:4-amino-4-deoxy-L-arabinose transferase-like glycosyltransferase
VAIRIPTQADLLWVLDRAGTGRRPYLALVALCLVLWLPGFFTLPPGDRDESRFAQASKQMLETGDFVQIRNGLVARNQKPIGIYWLQVPFAAAAQATGVAKANPIWPYRLPSLIGGLVAVLATYGFGRRLAGDRAALLSAAFLAASVILSVEVHVAKTDAVLLATTTVAMGLLSRAYLSPQSLGRARALLFWAALGAGILVKGPILPMVAGLAILSLIALDWRRGKPRWLLALHPLPGIAVLLAIVLPWFIAIGLATHGTFFTQSVGGDLGGKLTGSDDAHGAPFGLHLLLLPLLGFAGGIAALAGVPWVWQERRRPETRFLLAWILPAWLVFELVRTKLPHYTLPLYPAIALLAARWMCQPPAARSAWATVASSAAIAVALLLGIGAAALPAIADPGLHTVDLLGVPALAVAVALAWLLWRVWPDARRAALAMLCATPVLYFTLLGVELPLLSPLWIAPRVAEALRTYWPGGRPEGAEFGELGFAEPSLMFLCGTQTQLMGDPGQAAAFLSGGADRVLLVNSRDLPKLTATLKAQGQTPQNVATLSGYNYSRGQRVSLTLLSGYRMK